MLPHTHFLLHTPLFSGKKYFLPILFSIFFLNTFSFSQGIMSKLEQGKKLCCSIGNYVEALAETIGLLFETLEKAVVNPFLLFH